MVCLERTSSPLRMFAVVKLLTVEPAIFIQVNLADINVQL